MKGMTVWLKPEGAAAMLRALRIEYGGRTYYRTVVPVDRYCEFGPEDTLEVGATIRDDVIVPQDAAEAIAMTVEARYRRRTADRFCNDHPEIFEAGTQADAPPNVDDVRNWMVDEVPLADKVGFVP